MKEEQFSPFSFSEKDKNNGDVLAVLSALNSKWKTEFNSEDLVKDAQTLSSGRIPRIYSSLLAVMVLDPLAVLRVGDIPDFSKLVADSDLPTNYKDYFGTMFALLKEDGSVDYMQIHRVVKGLKESRHDAVSIQNYETSIPNWVDDVVRGLNSNWDLLNLLRDLADRGLDLTKIKESSLIQSPKEIMEDLFKPFEDIKAKYTAKEVDCEIVKCSQDIDTLLERLRAEDALGLYTNGALFNHFTSGAKLGELVIRSAASGVGRINLPS